MKPAKPPVPDLDHPLRDWSKEECNTLDFPKVKWLCCVKDCNCYSSAKDVGSLPLVWWRKKWVDLRSNWHYCSKHWKMYQAARKAGKLFTPLSGFKPVGWHHRIKQ